MAKAITGTELALNGVSNTTSRAVGMVNTRFLNMAALTTLVNNTSTAGTMIKYAIGDNSNPNEIFVSDSVATLKTALNTATTTNSINDITLTVKNDDGTTTTKNIAYTSIIRYYVYTGDTAAAGDSYVIVESSVKDRFVVWRCDETFNAITAALNA